LKQRDEERGVKEGSEDDEGTGKKNKKKAKKKWGIRDFRLRKAIQLSFYRTKNSFRGRYFVVLAAEKEAAAGFQVPHPSHVVPCHAATLHEKYLPGNTFLVLDLTNSAGHVLLFVRQCRATTRPMFSAIARRRGARSCGAMTCGLATSPSL
jgi:hypothetical protein